MSYDPLQFEYHSTPDAWACYYDPEGPSGYGKTKEMALEDLIHQCDNEHTIGLLAGAIWAAIDKPERELAEAVEQRDFHIQAAGGMVRREDGSLTLYGEQLRENAALREALRDAMLTRLPGWYENAMKLLDGSEVHARCSGLTPNPRATTTAEGISTGYEIVEYARVFDPPTEGHARRGFDPASPGGDRAVEVIGTVREGSVVVTEMREILGNSGDNAQSSTQREESAPK